MTFFKQKLRRSLRLLSDLPRNFRLVWKLLRDKRVPAANKGLYVLLVLGYFAIPTDFIPDFIPLLGQLDDLTVLLFLTERFIRYAPQNVVVEYLEQR